MDIYRLRGFKEECNLCFNCHNCLTEFYKFMVVKIYYKEDAMITHPKNHESRRMFNFWKKFWAYEFKLYHSSLNYSS